MGESHERREATDRLRTVKMRKQGATSGPYRTYGLVVPSWLAREIAGSDDPDEINAAMRKYEYLPERTREGILFRVVYVARVDGWPDESASS
jgi:hypothetical protein